ncbi:secretoglobin family 3A member 1 isoform X1 [Prionailurus viverrinus]|uniref:secretoglobin family 3A member 1 isoform X1 n=2 Tax=Prionailurus viverrinus TaxID=61388 RepID=UPI001FF34F05|nr:secretoglobin family 3A member 1 isoform X1 [Prionailurus viverrinus]
MKMRRLDYLVSPECKQWQRVQSACRGSSGVAGDPPCCKAATFFMDTMVKPVASALTDLNPAVEAGAEALAGAEDITETAALAGAGAMANPLLKGFSPLKFILTILGIPVEHLIEGSRKCVAELGPEAVGAVKSLLGSLMYLG